MMKRDVPHFRIGLLLTEAGILAPKQLDDAIQLGEQSGLPFLKVLVSTGSLKQHELQAVIRAQSLIWSGLLDVDRAIQALSIVHTNNVSIDEGLRSVGWARPEGTTADTIAAVVKVKDPEVSELLIDGNRCCQYCATPLTPGATLCAFCTGDNRRLSISSKVRLDPVWQREAAVMETIRISATIPARNPLLMAFLSGCCLAGVGQMVIGQSAKGICLMLLAIVLAFITGGVSSLIVFPLSALDAYLLADKLCNGKTIGPWEFF
jgi:hypothetical protein